MPKDKGKQSNPVTAAAKAAKQREIKKNKAATAASRTEKLARRNPDRLQKQLNELQSTKEAQSGKLRPKDQQTLEQLERDLRLVRKAREAQGQQGVKREDGDDARARRGGRGGRDGSNLGKRRRGSNGAESETETDEEVRRIPMPRDTPPRLPPREYQRAIRKGIMTVEEAFAERNKIREEQARLAAEEEKRRDEERRKLSKKSYESAPHLRDLRKEATSKFVPVAVAARQRAEKARQDAREGKIDRLLEPEELEEMERAEREKNQDANGDSVDNVDNVDQHLAEEERRLMAELGESAQGDARKVANAMKKEAKFDIIADEAGNAEDAEKKLHNVEMEEVEDEEYGGHTAPAPRTETVTTPSRQAEPPPPAPPQQDHGADEDEDDFW